jgi:antagonist of KipI
LREVMLEIVEAGGLLTVQDAGRRGWQKFGVPLSGPMDWFAFRAANALAGNAADAAALEIGFGDVTLRAHRDCVVAVTGAGFLASTFVWTFPLWTSFYVRNGGLINITKQGDGNWAYLAVAGRIQVEPVLGSRSTNLRAGLGMKLQAGDFLNTGLPSRSLDELAARTLPKEKQPVYLQSPVINVIQGPQSDWFTQDGHDTFLGSEYEISASSDRMGYRLEGPSITHARGADLLSEGMVAGSIQVPANSQPLVMMADCPTTGGYPKIANVVKADLPVLAQVPPRAGRIRFKMTTIEEAQSRYRSMMQNLEDGIDEVENDATFAQ